MPSKQQAIEYALSLQTAAFNRSVKLAAGKVDVMSRDIAKSAGRATRSLGRISKTIAGIGTAAAGAAALGGMYAFVRVLKESVELAGVQEAAEKKLEAVVRATGGAAGLSAEAMKQYAAQLQSVTTFGDEVTISNMAILATFKNIKGDEFKRATAAAQDMATVMDGDLKGSFVMLGKALNDPIKGMSALSRAGVTFTEAQKEQVKALQESGDLLGAQAIILEELEGQFKGVSAAARETFGGSVDAASNALGDLKEEIGFVITKNEFFIKGAQKVEQKFIAWTEAIKNNSEESRKYAKTVGMSLIGMAKGGLLAIDLLNRNFQGLVASFKGTAAAALMTAGGVFKLAQAASYLTDKVGLTEGAFEGWKTEAEAAFGAANKLATEARQGFKTVIHGSDGINAAKSAVQAFGDSMAQVGTDEAGQKISNGVKAATDEIKQISGAALKEMQSQWDRYADQVVAIQDKIAGREKSLAEELRSMGRSGMSDLGAWKDRKKEAREYEAAAMKAAQAGNFDEAVALADKAKAAYRDLNKEVTSGKTVLVSQATALKTAMIGVERAGKLGIKILDQQKKTVKDTAKELNTKAGGQLVKNFTEAGQQAEVLADKSKQNEEQLVKVNGVWQQQKKIVESVVPEIDKIVEKINAMDEIAMDEIFKNAWDMAGMDQAIEDADGDWGEVWDHFENNAKVAIDASEDRLGDLTRDRHVTVYVKEVIKKAAGGLVNAAKGYAIGGRVTGPGGIDKVPAWLTAGEVVIKQPSVRAAGLKAALAFNTGNWAVVIEELKKRLAGRFQLGGLVNRLPSLPSIPTFATGGQVLAGAGGETININLALPGASAPVPLQATRQNAGQLLRDLARMERLRS